jgi:hypothetical protein
MSVLTCKVEKCESRFETNEAFSPNASFICKNHPVSVQKKVAFQEHAFDAALNPGGGDKKESEEYDRDWGMSGDPLTASEKCPHGVYDPHEDQRYCSICNPVKITGTVKEVKKTKNGKIGAFKDSSEQADQEIALIMFYYSLPEHMQPAWFKDKELAIKARAKRGLYWLKKNNKSITEQFLENK